MAKDERLISVAEAFERVGGMYWLDRVGATIVLDWDDEPAVSLTDAKRAREAWQANLAEHEDRERRYAAYLQAQEAERDRIVREAHEQALASAWKKQQEIAKGINEGTIPSGWAPDSFPGLPFPDPETRSRASAEAWAVVRRWDAKRPMRLREDFD